MIDAHRITSALNAMLGYMDIPFTRLSISEKDAVNTIVIEGIELESQKVEALVISSRFCKNYCYSNEIKTQWDVKVL